jgi:hypothetical protein
MRAIVLVAIAVAGIAEVGEASHRPLSTHLSRQPLRRQKALRNGSDFAERYISTVLFEGLGT